jgi:hypothetical protein
VVIDMGQGAQQNREWRRRHRPLFSAILYTVETKSLPPWAELPGDVVDRVRTHLPEVVEEVIDAVGREVPEYRRPLEGEFGRGLRRGVEASLGHFLDLPGTTQPAAGGRAREIYVALGRGERQSGRTLEALLAAYRVGARIAFRRFAELARAEGLPDDMLVPLAVATFAYIDELSTASIEGYTAEQFARAGERDRLRSELVEIILSGTADANAVQDGARVVGWTLPEMVVPILVQAERSDGLAVNLGSDAIVAADPGTHAAIAIAPAPRRARDWQQLTGSLTGRRAVIGTPTPWAETATSLGLARLAARLMADGVLDGDPLRVDQRLLELMVHRDHAVAAALQAQALAPLTDLRPTTRDRLAETLLCWLRHRGERQRIADELHVHPQTVAYRVGQLRELFGDALNDPERRLAIELALRASG